MKKVLLVMFLLFTFSLVSSLSFTATTDTNVTIKELKSPITLKLDISDAIPGKYNLYTLADLYVSPSSIFQIQNTSLTKEFVLTPNENLKVEGYYTFVYTLNHKDVEKFDKSLTIKVLTLEDTLEISSESIDYDSKEISFYVRNKENVRINDLNVKFESILFDFKESFDLAPYEKKIIEVSVDESKLKKTKAGVYIIRAEFDTPTGDTIVNGNLYLGEKKGISVVEDSSGILINTKTITKTNTGNVIESVETRVEKNMISRLFTNFNIEPTSIERDGSLVTYVFERSNLGPSESFIVISKTNYIFPFLLLIVIALAIIGVKRYSQTKISLEKSVKAVKTKGGEFALRITLRVTATKSVNNVSIIDRVPQTVKLYKNFGALRPDKIDADTRRISWSLGNLNSGEERILTYIVYSKVGFVGKFILPKALAVFEKEEKIHEVDSNQVFFMSEQVASE